MELPVCVAYDVDGEISSRFPVTSQLNRAKPIYKTFEGWKCDISNIRAYDALPEKAKQYVKFIENEIGYPITYISNGPKRNDIIIITT